MTTTQIFIEHLIAGILTAVWLGLGVLTVVGLDSVDVDLLSEVSGVWAFVGLAVVYPLGVLVDQLADWMLGWAEERVKGRLKGELSRLQERISGRNISEKRKEKLELRIEKLKKINREYISYEDVAIRKIFIEVDKESINRYFEYVRVRIRIMRAAVLNFGLLALVLPAFLIRHEDYFHGASMELYWVLPLVGGLFCGLVAGLAFLAWWRITSDFWRKGREVLVLGAKKDVNRK